MPLAHGVGADDPRPGGRPTAALAGSQPTIHPVMRSRDGRRHNHGVFAPHGRPVIRPETSSRVVGRQPRRRLVLWWLANDPSGESLPVVGATTMQRIRSMGGGRSRTLQPPRGAGWKSSYFPRGRESRCRDAFGAHAPRGATTRQRPCASMEGPRAPQSIRSWWSAWVAVETLLRWRGGPLPSRFSCPMTVETPVR